MQNYAKKIPYCEYNNIVYLYQNGLHASEISKLYNVSTTSIFNILRKLNIKTKYHKHQITNPFDTITPSKAWVLGLYYSDGCITNNAILLSQKDTEILYKAKDIIGYIQKELKIKRNGNIFNLIIHSVELIKIFNSLGLERRKTRILKFPTWTTEETLSHFVRGCYDGDGSLAIRLSKKRPKYKGALVVSYTCGSLSFITSLKNLVAQITGTEYTIRANTKKNKKPFYMFEVTGKKALKFAHWLYKNSNDSNRMDRKYQVYLNAIERYNIKKEILPFQNKHILYDLYIKRQKSTVDIGKLLDCSASCICKWLKIHNIKIRDKNKRIEISWNKRK